MIIISITCKDRDESRAIAKRLVEERLIACANMWPIESIYFWEEELKEDREYMLMCKTKRERYEDVKAVVEEMHSYETPLIESWNVDSINKAYLDWLEGEVKRE